MSPNSANYWQSMQERMAREPRVPCMEDVFRLAERNPMVRACLASWRHGSMTLEQALITIVRELAAQNEKLSEMAVMELRHEVPRPITVTEPVGG